MVYAHLVSGGDQEGREKFDREVNAPAVGWEVAQSRFWEIVDEEGAD